MSASGSCAAYPFCTDCSKVCNHRIIECNNCGEVLQLRVDGTFPRIGFIDGGNFTFPCERSQVFDELERTSFDLFTFLQKPGMETLQYSYPFELDNLAILPITTFDNWWEKQIGTKARNQVRRSEKKGVEVQESALTDELVDAICEIYNESPFRQGRKFVHYGIDRERAKAYAGTYPKQSVFVVARHEGRIVGFTKFAMNRASDFASFFHLISFKRDRDKSVNNALIAGAIRACAARGVRQLAYAKFSYGNKTGGLAEFKLNNGFGRVDIPRYYVVRNLRGAVALRLGLHHKLSERIPESIASRFRELRAKWYAGHAVQQPARQA